MTHPAASSYEVQLLFLNDERHETGPQPQYGTEQELNHKQEKVSSIQTSFETGWSDESK